jgi:hypothetical protein
LIETGREGRIRTYECGSQSAVSYRLTTSLYKWSKQPYFIRTVWDSVFTISQAIHYIDIFRYIALRYGSDFSLPRSIGAEYQTRTDTVLLPVDFKSTMSAIPSIPQICKKLIESTVSYN